jgi:hypothetical protein
MAGHDRDAQVTIFCPAFFTTTDTLRAALTLIHEASHGAPWAGARAGHSTEDFAYRWMRAISYLRPETAVANADSYVLFVEWLNSRTPAAPAGTRPAMGHPTADDHPTLAGAEGTDAERALAFAEQRVMFAHQVMRNVYNNLVTHAASGTSFTHEMWQRVAPAIFPHRDPAAAPVPQDVHEAAGILDRLTVQYDRFRTSTGITMERRDSGDTRWWGGPSGPGARIEVGADFRAAAGDHEQQAQIFLRALVRATGSIDPSLGDAYLHLYEAARLVRGGTTPP